MHKFFEKTEQNTKYICRNPCLRRCCAFVVYFVVLLPTNVPFIFMFHFLLISDSNSESVSESLCNGLHFHRAEALCCTLYLCDYQTRVCPKGARAINCFSLRYLKTAQKMVQSSKNVLCLKTWCIKN